MYNTKKKILFILHIPPPVHGSSIVGEYIYKSEYINQNFECQFNNLGTSNSIDEIGNNLIIKINRYFQIVWKVIINLIKSRPDLCYFAITSKGLGLYKDAFLAFLVKLFRIKLVYHFHNKGVSTYQDKFFNNLIYKFIFKNADVILLSEYLYSDIQRYVPKERIHYCPNGISERTKLNKGNSDSSNSIIEILFLSNLIVSKGVFILLDTCKILKSRDLSFHCTFIGAIGNIKQEQFQEKIKESDLQDVVNYVGPKFGNEKEDALIKADIFVHPTFNDCFPLVLIEAMQFSLPIVSTVEGGIPDIVEDEITGYLVPKMNAVALAEKLELLIRSKELRNELGKNGHNRYLKYFTINQFESNLTKILNECLSN